MIMNKNKNLHVCRLDKFIPPFIRFLRKEFPGGGNFFYTLGDHRKYECDGGADWLHQTGGGGYIYLIFLMHRSEKIILHGLFDFHVILILALCPWLRKKCYWVMWGGDYINDLRDRGSLKSRLKKNVKRRVIQNVANLITFMPGSVEMVREQYGAKGHHHECLAYPSNIFTETTSPRQSDDTKVRVLVGNSANPSNRHFDIFDHIAPLVNDSVILYVPLSYGDARYADEVIQRGRMLFGGRFVPMTELMPPDEYAGFLRRLDLALFNHNRQQAMGTTINLLGMGKAVYMRDDIPSWHFLKSKGVKVRNISTFAGFHDSFFESGNLEAIKAYFSEENLRKQWKSILYE